MFPMACVCILFSNLDVLLVELMLTTADDCTNNTIQQNCAHHIFPTLNPTTESEFLIHSSIILAH